MKKFKTNRALIAAFLLMLCSIAAAYWIAAPAIVIVSLPSLILVPGFLSYVCITENFDIAGSTWLYSTGLGLLFITLEGLLLNLALPVITPHSHPLTTGNIIATHIVLTGLLLISSEYRFRNILAHKTFTLPSPRQISPNILLCFLPLMAAAGAVELNNGGSSFIALVTTYAVLVLLIVQLTTKRLFSWGWLLYIVALSMLLSTSLRSSYVAGFDISHEFQVFQRTLMHKQWFPSAGDPYNSCLSLTILPTALHSLLNISPAFIFKFVYQALYAVVPVVIYETFRPFAKSSWAFVAALFYIGQTQFITTMPAIVRQEIALIYFSLMIMLLFGSSFKNYTKLLFIAFSFGMVTAHYSTAYIGLLLLSAYYVFSKITPPITNYFSKTQQPNFPKNITLSMLGVIFLALLLWYGQVNFSAGNLTNVYTKTYDNLGNIFKLDSRSEVAQRAFYGSSNVGSQKTLDGYLNGANVSEKSSIVPAGSVIIPDRAPVLTSLINGLRSLLLLVTKLSLIIGMLYIFFKALRNDKLKPIAFMSASSLVILLAVGLLPSLSLSYNLERVYQQILDPLAFIMVVVTFANLPFLAEKIKYILACLVVVLYFALSPGSAIVNQFTGGISPRMNYSNSGDDYQKLYVHGGDVLASQWTTSRCDKLPIFTDRYSELKVLANTSFPQEEINQNILSSTVGRCTLLDYTNTHNKLVYETYQSQEISFSMPNNYYSNSYSTVYTNSQDNVYIRIH